MRLAPALAAGLALAPLAAGEPPDGDGAPAHRETPTDPYRPRPPVVPAPVPPLPLPADASFGVQVNVDDNGENIPGDAANEPSIAVDPTAPNRIVIGWRQFDTVTSSFRQAGWGFSHDGGRSWTFPGVIEPGVFRSDPVLGIDAEGTFHYCSLRVVNNQFTVQFFKSFDGGRTWGSPLNAFGGDKQWFVIDRTGGIGHGNVYMAWNRAAGCCGDATFTRSTDGGLSFSLPVEIFGRPRFGTLDVAGDGTLLVSGIGTAFDQFIVIGSSNAQDPSATPVFEFGAIVDLGGSMVLGAGPNPGGLLGQLDVGVDPSLGPAGGNVYLLCSVDPPGPDPLDVMFARSADGGVTWSPPVRVNDDAGNHWQWFATMAVAPDGRIDVVWNDTRNGGGLSNVSELFYSSSADGGETWSPNVALSPPFDSHVGWPNQQKLGDYYDMVADLVGADLAYAATFNGEQDVYYLRIGERDCNGNGIADTLDVFEGASLDCNGNQIPDECEVAAGTAEDEDGDGLLDGCQCAADLNDDGIIGINDLLELLIQWGTDPGGPPDLDGDGVVGIADMLILLDGWGPCP